MNVYSDDIILDIMNYVEKDETEERIDKFYQDAEDMFCYFSYLTLSVDYIRNLFNRPSNKFVFYSMDTDDFYIDNCPCGLIYTEENNVYYILMICTRPKFKNMGYASIMLDGFIRDLKLKVGDKGKIILSSVESAVIFYEKYGFRWTREPIQNYPKLLESERLEENKEYFIMEKCL